MTWPDVLLIVVWFIFLALGARLGSVFTGACVLGGFFGAALVDYYALPMGSLMGGFTGSTALAAILLYIGGVAAILIPGLILSRISSALFLGLIDGTFGILT